MEGFFGFAGIFWIATFVVCFFISGYFQEREKNKQKKLDFFQKIADSVDSSQKAAITTNTTSLLPHTQFTKYGPSKPYADFLLKRVQMNPKPNELLSLIETYLVLQQYTDAETWMRSFMINQANDEQCMRFYNAQMKLYIMTGRTEKAVEIFAKVQTFADRFLLQTGRGLIQYLDNAAMICALTGDFEEADQYCKAMWNAVGADGSKDAADLYPYLTETKIMFLRGEKEKAEIQIRAAERVFQEYRDYQYVWEREYMLTLLARTRLFDVSLSDVENAQTMPEIREM